MAKVVLSIDKNTGEREALDAALRRFKKQVFNENIIQECKKREYYMSKSLKRREKSKEAQKRLRKSMKKRKQY